VSVVALQALVAYCPAPQVVQVAQAVSAVAEQAADWN